MFFLHVESNRTELFYLLAEELVTEAGFKELVITRDNLALSNRSELNKTQLTPYNHEEPDTRIFVHNKDLASQCHGVITVATVDMDVIVIAISCFDGLASTMLKQLWVEFCAVIDKRWIRTHSLAIVFGKRCGRLLFWYAFTGCDTVSAFGGKLTAWATWQVFDKATPLFPRYSKPCHGFDPHKDNVRVIERFTCLLYDRVSTVEDVNDCRRKLFTNRGQSVDGIPPTRDALVQHIRRAVYQAG